MKFDEGTCSKKVRLRQAWGDNKRPQVTKAHIGWVWSYKKEIQNSRIRRFDRQRVNPLHDNEFDGLDIPIIRTGGAKKAIMSGNEKLRHYDEYMAMVWEVETFSKVAKDPPWWIETMHKEIQAVCKNETWDLVPYSPHKKAIDCKWIFKVKYNANSLVNRYKSDKVDYEETFVPVAKMKTVWTIIALTTIKGRHLHQMDVKNAFLQGELEEEALMIQPPGFESTLRSRNLF